MEPVKLKRNELLLKEIIYSPNPKVVLTIEEDMYLSLYYNTTGDTFIELDRVPLDGVSSLDDVDMKIRYLMAEYNLKEGE